MHFCKRKKLEKKPLKIFISQPYTGRSDEEILAERESSFERIKEQLRKRGVDCDIELIDQFHESYKELESEKMCGTEFFSEYNERVFMLGHSLKLLAEASFVAFVGEWRSSTGCRIEHEIAEEYKIPDISKIFEMDYHAKHTK